MHARHLLLNRSSMPRLIAPGPTPADLELLQAAALRVPDHMNLVPYQFFVLQGEELEKLGQVFQRAAQNENMGDQAVARAPELPLRAPLVFVLTTRYQSNDKVPRAEQFASAACAGHAVLQMAFVQGYGAVWRTGPYAESNTVKEALGVANEDIVGFIYIGTPAVATPIKPAKTETVFFPSPL